MRHSEISCKALLLRNASAVGQLRVRASFYLFSTCWLKICSKARQLLLDFQSRERTAVAGGKDERMQVGQLTYRACSVTRIRSEVRRRSV